MTSDRYICIHTHFYQPPRENPWVEAIDYQDSARPFHDWNEKIDFECYRPNGQSRILDAEGRVIRLTNNYARVSFNFGPTLLSWMEDFDPAGYAAILEGDRQSRDRFGGHGSAIAQAYNHMILPLANRRDKETQVIWGLRDFERRFGRAPESMWLPEAAVNTETLEILAGQGLKYVILAPRQAMADNIDTRLLYHIALPGGKSIAAFFYDGGISQAVAFERLLNNGETFANRLINGFDNRGGPQLLHIATDGESYGHHHRHGDMALAYALDTIEHNPAVSLINYGEYLEKFPPHAEMRIAENSSWSCVHGIERWRADCGCCNDHFDGWTQKWRAPLRQAMDMLRDRTIAPFETLMADWTADAWGMRNDYIDLIEDRSDAIRSAFFKKWLKNPADSETPGVQQKLLKALECQRNLLLAYTSCGWFFDDISGTEPIQNMQYAARAMELARDIFGIDLEDDFKTLLESAPSNVPEFINGSKVYEHFAVPARVDFLKLGAHLAAIMLFREKFKKGSLYCFDYFWTHVERMTPGKAQCICASVQLTSRITLEMQEIEFAIIHLGDQNITVGVLPYSGEAHYKLMVQDFTDACSHGDIVSALRLLDRYFEGNTFSLNDLLHDQQKQIVDIVLSQTLESLEDQFNNIYEQHYPVMRHLADIHVTLPPVFAQIARFVQGARIAEGLGSADINLEDIKRRIREVKTWGVDLDADHLGAAYLKALQSYIDKIRDGQRDAEIWQGFIDLLNTKPFFPFPIDTGTIQSAYALWFLTERDAGPFANDAAVLLSIRDDGKRTGHAP